MAIHGRSLFLPLLLLLLCFPTSNLHVAASLFSVEYGHPISYRKGDTVPLLADPMTSVHTQIDTSYSDLPLCQPSKGESAGTRLEWRLPYEVKVLEEVQCKKLCQVTLTAEQAKTLSFHIQNDYRHKWKLDNLPALSIDRSFPPRYTGGFPVGLVSQFGDYDFYVFNHVKLTVVYVTSDNGYRIVEFAVSPFSVIHPLRVEDPWHGVDQLDQKAPLSTCFSSIGSVIQDTVGRVQIGEPILFTYDVYWVETEDKWSQRWRPFLAEVDYMVPKKDYINSFAISITISAFLSVVISCILIRNVKRDMASSRGRSEDDDDERKGWKALGGHVFQPPKTLPHLFCAMVGTGVQLALTGLLVLLLATVNIVSPAKQGSLGMAIWIVYIFFGSPIAGYVSGRLYGNFGGKDWKECVILTTLLFPACILACLLAFSMTPSITKLSWVELLLWAAGSFLVSFPLILTTSKMGHYQGETDRFPTITASVDRSIPPPICRDYCMELVYFIFTGVSPYCATMKIPWVTFFSAGFISFVQVFLGLIFIMDSMFMHQYNWTVGYALVIYIILMATCSWLTILFVYHRLNHENHQWWWPAFFIGGSVSVYIFGISFLYTRKVQISPWMSSYVLYFGQMFIISLGVFLLCGSMGCLAALVFVRKLFSNLRPREDNDYVELLNVMDDNGEAEEVKPMRIEAMS